MDKARDHGSDSAASKWKISRAEVDPNGEWPEWVVSVQKIALTSTPLAAVITLDGQLSWSQGSGSPNHNQVLEPEIFMTIRKLVTDLWEEGAQPEYGGQEEIYRVTLLDGPHAFTVQNIGKIFSQRSVATLFNYVVGLIPKS